MFDAFADEIPPGLAIAGPGASLVPNVGAISERDAELASDWEQTRRRPDGQFNTFVGGFGTGGRYQLCLPSPMPETRPVFRNGIPQIEAIEGIHTDPEISTLRDVILRSFVIEGAEGELARFAVDIALLSYSAAIILRNYTVTDDDLTFLHQGDKWIGPMMQHCVGGPSVIQRLALLSDAKPVEVPIPSPEPIAPQNASGAAPRASKAKARSKRRPAKRK